MSWLTNPAARVRAIGVSLLLLTFAVGGLAGAAARQVVTRDLPAVHGDGGCDRGDSRDRRLGLYEELELSDTQRSEIERIMNDRRTQIDALLEVHEPRMKAIVDSTNAEIQSLLTPDQREEFSQLRAELRARRQAEREQAEREQAAREQSRSRGDAS
jgi:Spy/CpxP family protein refolding chaperone